MTCLQVYLESLPLSAVLRVHANSKVVSYLSWHMYPNLKTTRHIKVKFFLQTKLLENLLLAKYLKSVNAPLRKERYTKMHIIFTGKVFL